MSIERTVDCRCDLCGRKAQCDSATAREARANAALDGWKRIGSQDYCRFCVAASETRREGAS